MLRESLQPRGAWRFLGKRQQSEALRASLGFIPHHPQHLISTEKQGTVLSLCFLPAFKEMLSHPCSTLGIKDLRKIPGPAQVRRNFAFGFTEAKCTTSLTTSQKALLEVNRLPTFIPRPSWSCHLSNLVTMLSTEEQ